jgi:hypothetical protein
MDNKSSWCQMWGSNDKAIAFNPLDPSAEMIDIETIARALSNQCRFNGHVRNFFSVAQHSIMVSEYCAREDALWGLLHDASEAYIVDIPRPLKRWEGFSGYMALEKRIMEVICGKFDLSLNMPDSVSYADDLILRWEFRDNLQPRIEEIFQQLQGDDSDLPKSKLFYFNPKEAELVFLERFERLSKRG